MPTNQSTAIGKTAGIIFIALLVFISFKCKKPEQQEILPIESSKSIKALEAATSTDCDVTTCEDCSFQETIENDTTDYPTILGSTYANPYSIQVMTQAYNYVHGTNIQAVSTTHFYVRFKPQTVNDLNKLDSLDLELYDYPLDRVVIQDGDYWPDAYTNLGPNEYPWLYTVVASNFQFPAGITYENLAPLNIPDDDAALEDKAFSLTGNMECGSSSMAQSGSGSSYVMPQCIGCGGGGICSITGPTQVSPGSSYTYNLSCGDGSWAYSWDLTCGTTNEWTTNQIMVTWNTSGCTRGTITARGEDGTVLVSLVVTIGTPPPPPPNLYPQGMITYKTYNDYGVIPPSAPLKYTRIVARRFFKIDKTYTDANGNFQLSKRFPKKVTIIVKFRTSSVSIRHEPQIFFMAWKKWFPIRKNIGTYKGNNLQNLNYVFQKGTTSRKMKTRRWLSSIAINTFIETQNFLSSNNLIQLSNKSKIYLRAPVLQDLGETAQYEFLKRSYYDGDVHLDWLTSDISSLTTSKVTVNVAQQLGISYLDRVNDDSHDNINFLGPYISSLRLYSEQYGRFGNGILISYDPSYNPDLIAMWQALGQHLGHTIADRIYGYGEYYFQLQGKTWTSSGGVSSSSKYVEGFDPSIGEPNESFKWIPVGLINDLMDNQTDPFPVNDNVSGFTYSEIQSAYYSEPQYMANFKAALKAIKPSQATAIDQLFASYGY